MSLPLALSMTAAVLSPAPVAAQRTPLVTAIDSVLRAEARTSGFAGTVVVHRRGATLHRQAIGLADRAQLVPTRVDTRYRIASITKLFTSTLVLMLRDQGRLELTQTIRAYLPDYAGAGADRVTLLQLLNHTSGIRNFDQITSYADAVARGIESYQLPHSPDELIARWGSGPLEHAPGTTFDYNNADYLILGRIIERVTGKPLDTVLRELILVPLALAHTTMGRQQEVVPRLAPTYFKSDSAAPLINDMPVYIQNWWSAGGMLSTADDVAIFADALFGGRLLTPESLRLLLAPGLDEYGLGLWITTTKIGGRERRLAHRPGSIMGANTALVRYLDDEVTIVVLANTNLADVDRLAFRIGRVVLR